MNANECEYPRRACWARGANRRRLVLLLACATAAIIWGAFLPWIAARPAVAARLQSLSDQGIDPSAMFYSELAAMEGVLLRLEELHRDHPDALWTFAEFGAEGTE